MTMTVPEAIERGRTLTVPALRATVARLHPRLRHVVEYHRGWVDADGNPQAGGGGKLVRPALALLSAEAAGQPAEVGLPAAVAVELVHDFSLLHDDLMDGDTERRHRPTAWTVFGADGAILAGDALLGLATQILLEVEGEPGRRAAAILGAGVQDLVRGQAEDLLFESRSDVTVAETLHMEDGKTGALLACAASLGAVLADAPKEVVDGLAEFGSRLGTAFQLIDDLLGIWGDPAVTGKPVLSDLQSRKKSVPVVVALEAGGPDADELREFLVSEGDRPVEDLERVAALIERAGGRDWTTDEADRQLKTAGAVLRSLSLPPLAEAELLALARFVTERDC
ncbi:polyprenyl synthetase family protein [Frankia sp. CNm7]|uniref:Polyprenyl synthetase family protein n=1 Tax=Frankia nepalensis TaxID=1836974 RepID=A0A937RNW6_9ACTN|nr:polyprenyl synthetase family protein [Frankia nepalensis]MBL7497256.1 polyprenyl synthetase family protein [Frankia nepalensis]MBL7515344.1 polyprenyl synthetase family protein [Frankia nepalensis]MBL7522392.1 polyprenyl synthetase family protein [Frankia nepalensis]MBL7632320.1 polyprenyl synthetase family protein [Frankia nepalensis]